METRGPLQRRVELRPVAAEAGPALPQELLRLALGRAEALDLARDPLRLAEVGAEPIVGRERAAGEARQRAPHAPQHEEGDQEEGERPAIDPGAEAGEILLQQAIVPPIEQGGPSLGERAAALDQLPGPPRPRLEPAGLHQGRGRRGRLLQQPRRLQQRLQPGPWGAGSARRGPRRS